MFYYYIIISHISSPDLAVTVFMVLSENNFYTVVFVYFQSFRSRIVDSSISVWDISPPPPHVLD